jgi:hypothetical protein
MKTVARVLWMHEADLLRARLEGGGIEVFIPDEGMATAQPLIGNTLGGIRIQVCDEDEERALEILAEPGE